MTHTADLHLHLEILPLFDFTHNDYSKQVVTGMLAKPLSSVHAILLQQHIFRGFIENLDILQHYAYARADLHEVHTFLQNYSGTVAIKGLHFRLLLSEKERHQTRGRYIQFILFLHKFTTSYLNRIDTQFFPESYKTELQSMHDLLSRFGLSNYEELIREQKFRVKHIVELAAILSQKAANGELDLFWKRYFQFEAYLSISIGITAHRFSFPAFSGNVLSLEELYHPVLKHPVKNSFTIHHNVTLLTGRNMSGKSTFLKAVGLCVYLGHLGFAIPASKAAMPFFDVIFVSIQVTDDIVNGYSHFMTEILQVKKVVLEATNHKKCFAIFDELFSRTNIEDALAISSTTIKGLTKFTDSFFFISTHLHQLKEIEEVQHETVAVYYINCELQEDVPVFTYQLKSGWSDLRLGQLLFEREGLNTLLDNTAKKLI